MIREINNIDELLELRPHWNALLDRTPRATFFLTLDWLESYWRHCGAGQHLRVLAAYDDDTLIGIVPLVVRRESTRIGNARVLTFPLDEWGSFYGPLGEKPLATLTAAWRHIRGTHRDWDMIDLRCIDNDRVDQGCTERVMQSAQLATTRQIWREVPEIELDGCWESYWMSRTSKWRNNVRRSEKKLAACGELRYLRFRPAGAASGDGDPGWSYYEECERIAGASWQGASTKGTTLSHDSVRGFLRDAHARAAQRGECDINLLFVGDAPIAFTYNYMTRGRVFGLRMGYDSHRARDGAGSVLMARMIEDSFQRGDLAIDLGAHMSAFKRYWQTSLASSYRYCHYPLAAPRAQALRLKRWFDRRRKSRAESDSIRSARQTDSSSIQVCSACGASAAGEAATSGIGAGRS